MASACRPVRNVKAEINPDDITAMSMQKLIELLKELGALPKSISCHKCGAQMELTPDQLEKDGFQWTCRAADKEQMDKDHRQKKKVKRLSDYRCNNNRSLRKGKFFAGSKLSLHQIVNFVIYYMDKVALENIEKYVRISHKTAVDCASFCREVCYDAAIERCTKIGGVDENGEPRVVEIDESKFGKRKYHKGRRVEGQWVFGGVERGTGRLFMVPVEKRDKEKLLAVIKHWILPGSTIYSDSWKAYDCLGKEGFEHLKVNHKITFVDRNTGCHTQLIESSWRHAKVDMPAYRRHKEFFAGYLAKHMFVKRTRYSGEDKMVAFFEAAGRLYDASADNTEDDQVREEGDSEDDEREEEYDDEEETDSIANHCRKVLAGKIDRDGFASCAVCETNYKMADDDEALLINNVISHAQTLMAAGAVEDDVMPNI